MLSILENALVSDFLLPGVLVIAIIFAILEKTNVLGEGKHQINAIVALISALILLSFETSRNLVVGLIPLMVIMAIVIFIVLLLYGFVSGDKKGDPLGKGVKIAIGVVIGVVLVIALLVLTDNWDNVIDFFTSTDTGANVVFIIVVVVALVAVLFGGGKSKPSGD